MWSMHQLTALSAILSPDSLFFCLGYPFFAGSQGSDMMSRLERTWNYKAEEQMRGKLKAGESGSDCSRGFETCWLQFLSPDAIHAFWKHTFLGLRPFLEWEALGFGYSSCLANFC